MVWPMAAHREKAQMEVVEEMGDTRVVAVACVPGVYLSQEDSR